MKTTQKRLRSRDHDLCFLWAVQSIKRIASLHLLVGKCSQWIKCINIMTIPMAFSRTCLCYTPVHLHYRFLDRPLRWRGKVKNNCFLGVCHSSPQQEKHVLQWKKHYNPCVVLCVAVKCCPCEPWFGSTSSRDDSFGHIASGYSPAWDTTPEKEESASKCHLFIRQLIWGVGSDARRTNLQILKGAFLFISPIRNARPFQQTIQICSAVGQKTPSRGRTFINAGHSLLMVSGWNVVKGHFATVYWWHGINDHNMWSPDHCLTYPFPRRVRDDMTTSQKCLNNLGSMEERI